MAKGSPSSSYPKRTDSTNSSDGSGSFRMELTADRLQKIRGLPGAGPYVAGEVLWEHREGLWQSIKTTAKGWKSVSVRAPDDVWVVGHGGRTAHLGPSGWQEQSFDKGVAGISVGNWEGEAWASAAYGEIFRHDGAGWTSWTPAALSDRHTGSMWGAAVDDVWMHTGRRTTGVPPDVGHWDG